MRVATFNIRNGRGLDGWNSWPFRRRRLVDQIAALGVDVIGLQEVFSFQQRYLRRRLPGHDFVSRARGRRFGERIPVVYNTSTMRLLRASTRWFSEHPDRPGSKLPNATFARVATLVEFEEISSGRRFGVANLHLDARVDSNRTRSITMLCEWLDRSVDWIVLGDFNAEDGDPELQLLLAEGFESLLDDSAGGTNHGFERHRDGKRIDHIFVRGEFHIDESHVEADCEAPATSDHWPVVADLHMR